jgi:hypothetical protein
MLQEYYCKLYVDSNEDHESLQETIDSYVGEIFSEITAVGTVYRNENFEPERRNVLPYEFIQASRNYIELDSDGEPEGRDEEFQIGTIKLVKLLREGGRIVTASCKFEERIASETGWNWTRDNPNPPRR